MSILLKVLVIFVIIFAVNRQVKRSKLIKPIIEEIDTVNNQILNLHMYFAMRGMPFPGKEDLIIYDREHYRKDTEFYELYKNLATYLIDSYDPKQKSLMTEEENEKYVEVFENLKKQVQKFLESEQHLCSSIIQEKNKYEDDNYNGMLQKEYDKIQKYHKKMQEEYEKIQEFYEKWKNS